MPTELLDLMPRLQELRRFEKLYIIQFLVSELAQEEAQLIQPELSYSIWSPYEAFDAATVMLNALAEEKGSPYGA